MITQNRRLSIDHLNEIIKLIERVDWMKKRIKRVSRTNGSEAIEIWCEHYPASCPVKCKRVRKLGILAATTDGPRGASADFLNSCKRSYPVEILSYSDKANKI